MFMNSLETLEWIVKHRVYENCQDFVSLYYDFYVTLFVVCINNPICYRLW